MIPPSCPIPWAVQGTRELFPGNSTMRDRDKTKVQLIQELKELRRWVADSKARQPRNTPATPSFDTTAARLNAILKAFDGFVYVCSRDYRIEFMDERLVRRKGYDGTGGLCHRVLHERDSVCPWCANEHVFRGETVRWETRGPKDDRWYDVISAPIVNPDGTLSKLELIRDVTERVWHEREIKLLNRLYRVLSRVSQAVVRATSPEVFLEEACRVIVDEGGFLLAWIGYVDEESHRVVPTAIWGGAYDYAHGISVYADDRPEGRGPTGSCIRHKRPFVYNDFLHDQPTKPWHERAAGFGIKAAAAFPIESGGRVWGALTIYSDEIGFFGLEDVKLLEKVAGDIGFALDNLERERRRQKAEAELRESQQQLSYIIDFLPDATLVVDKERKVIAWNRAVEEMTGVRKEDILGKGDYAYAVAFYGKPRPMLLDMVVTGGAEPAAGYDFVERKGNQLRAEGHAPNAFQGRGAYVWGTAAPLYDREGNIAGAIESIRDISKRKAMESALQQREKALENKTHQLEEMNAALNVLLQKRADDEKELQESVLANLKEMVLPYLDKIKQSRLDETQRTYIGILESHLNEVLSPFLKNLSTKFTGLTPTELQVAGLVKDGKTTKEIARLLGVAPKTVSAHRYNLRVKLGLKNEKINLRSHLLSHG